MGSVHLARRLEDRRICVIKRLRPELAADSTVAQRFLREAQIASLLAHPNIARLIDAWRDDGGLHLAMEHVAGVDLDSILQRLRKRGRVLPPELAIAVSFDVLTALHHAHESVDPTGAPLSIVHRDLTPRNVMISFEGEVKIIDFGIARAALGEFRTNPGNLVGTPGYMSPEQALGRAVDRTSDLYSWAVVLHEMLTGSPLVAGGGLRQILAAIVREPAPPLRARAPHLSVELERVLERALRKDSAERYASALELRDALATAAGLGSVPSDALEALLAELFPDELQRHLQRSSEPALVAHGPEFQPTRAVASPAGLAAARPPGAGTPRMAVLSIALLAAVAVLGVLATRRDTPAAPPVRVERLPEDPVAVASPRPPEAIAEPPASPPPLPRPSPAPKPRRAVAPPAIPAARSLELPWTDEVMPLIQAGELDEALASLQALVESHRLPPKAQRTARRCVANLDHTFSREGFDDCVQAIVRAGGAPHEDR